MKANAVADYLVLIDEVIKQGPFKDNWESLGEVGEPKWYKDAKFGIFIHWGAYAVPAFGNEWYVRNMFQKQTDVYKHHVETYGEPKDYPYTNFIDDFKAENYDPKAWADLFKEAGAKFVMPVAEHHDGFQLYDSEISDWNATKKGPMRDVMGDLKKEVEAQDMVFTASSHRAENFWFMNGALEFDSGLDYEGYVEPYGYRIKVDDTIGNPTPKNDYGDKVPVAHLEDWLARTCELVDKYQPKVVWFDWWIQNVSFKPYLKKFAAYYYNRGVQWGVGVSINYKDDAYPRGSAIFDVERGQLKDISPRFWQTDTAVAKNSWGFTNNNDFKKPERLVCDLLDIISKNGAMLLNVGPRADGTITDEDAFVLRSMGKWIKTNEESIYGTDYWIGYGEGPTEVEEGTFMEKNQKDYVEGDVRFTYKAPYVYAHILKWPKEGKVTIRSFAAAGRYTQGSMKFKGLVEDVSLLGYDNATSFTREEDGMHITVDGEIDTTFPVTVKITID